MVMGQFGYEQEDPTIIFEDNWACIYLSKNSVLYHKSKHIDVQVYHLRDLCNTGVKYHLRDLCNTGVAELIKVGTNDQVADAFTKSLPLPAFAKHRKSMLGMQRDHQDDGDE